MSLHLRSQGKADNFLTACRVISYAGRSCFISSCQTKNGIAQRLGYRTDDKGVGVRIPIGTKKVSLLHYLQTGSAAASGSYIM
jgi:hypothetical protein